MLARDDVDAVAIATPARTHHPIAMAALRAGKHVLVEKPLADSVPDGREMVAAAEAHGLVLMTDHTYCYTPAVQRIRELVADGALGEILFVDSVRINLGLIQPDVDVFWDLAPHDLSILDYVLPGGLRSRRRLRAGRRPDRCRQGLRRLPDAAAPGRRDGARARQLAQPDQDPPARHRRQPAHAGLGRPEPAAAAERLRPRRRPRRSRRWTAPTARGATVSYRLGDTWAPALPEREALGAMVAEFAASIREARAPQTDGHAGLRVLSVLEAAARQPAGPAAALADVASSSPGWSWSDDALLNGRAGSWSPAGPGRSARRSSTSASTRVPTGWSCSTTWSAVARRTSTTRGATAGVDVVVGDIRDRDLVHDLCRGQDVVFHQAAIRITQCAEEPRLALEVLVDGTFNVVEAAAAARVDKLVAASSAASTASPRRSRPTSVTTTTTTTPSTVPRSPSTRGCCAASAP